LEPDAKLSHISTRYCKLYPGSPVKTAVSERERERETE
jgi:hypothetical protein